MTFAACQSGFLLVSAQGSAGRHRGNDRMHLSVWGKINSELKIKGPRVLSEGIEDIKPCCNLHQFFMYYSLGKGFVSPGIPSTLLLSSLLYHMKYDFSDASNLACQRPERS